MSTPDPTAKAIDDRMTLEKVAASYNNLMELQKQQRMTQAQLIRWAMYAIDKPAPQSNRGRINTHQDWREAMEKHRADQKLARTAMEWLADKLDGKEIPDFEIN